MRTDRKLALKMDWNSFCIGVLLKVNGLSVKCAEKSIKKVLKLQAENRSNIKKLAEYYIEMDFTEQKFEDLQKDLGL